MSLSPELAVVGLGILLAVWYLFASIFNRRRGIAIYRWLQADLDEWGGEISGRWIGSSGSGARIRVHQANPPFKEIDMIYLLASRELLPLFLVDLLRGKTDRLIVKLTLRSNPNAEIEVVRQTSSLARQMQGEKNHPWAIQPGPGGLQIGTRGTASEALLANMRPLLEKYDLLVQQVSWSKKSPHLIVILSLAGLPHRAGSAADLFKDLAAVATSTSRVADANGTTT